MTSTNESGTLRTTATSSELESEELSAETTVPTDLTLTMSLDSDVVGGGGGHARRRVDATDSTATPSAVVVGQHPVVTRQLLERKQLLHDLQLLKIELSQKTLIIDNLKADTMGRTEELEERLAETRHAKQILQARLESQLRMQQQETLLELDVMRRKQTELEAANVRLRDAAVDVRRTLHNLSLDEQQYGRLLLQDPAQLSLQDFVAVKIFEIVRPHEIEVDNLRAKVHQLNEANKLLLANNEQLKEELDDEHIRANNFQSKHNRCVGELKNVQSQIQLGDYRIENYDKLKSERDQFMEEALETKKTLSIMEATSTATLKELDDLKMERGTTLQKVSLLQQDKDFLNKRMLEISSQCRSLEEQLARCNLKLENATQAREALYEKYVNSRDLYKSEFESKLKEEIDDIHKRTCSEIDLLKATTKNVYDQELRSLRDARDSALQNRDEAELSRKIASEKCETLLEKLRVTQSDMNELSTNLKGQLMVKSMELEQLRAVHVETRRSHQECQLENEKLQKKVEVLGLAVNENERKQISQLSDIKSKLDEKTVKLSMYEKMEQDLDDVVMQAAEERTVEGNQMIDAFGNGAALPIAIKRRMQHSFQLAKRILLLEKQNLHLEQQIGNHKKCSENLAQEIVTLKETLDNVDKPHSHLIDIIKLKDDEIRNLKIKISELEKKIGLLKSDQELMENHISRLSTDMEKMLNNREEIGKMKHLLVNLFPHHFKDLLEANNLSGATTQRKWVTATNPRLPPSTIITKPKVTTKQSWK